MTYSIPYLSEKRRSALARALTELLGEVKRVRARAGDLGFEEAAESLLTLANDLRWQIEELEGDPAGRLG